MASGSHGGSGSSAHASSARSAGRNRGRNRNSRRTPGDDDSSETVSAPTTAVATILATLVGAGLLAVGVDVLTPAAVAAVAGGLLTATVTATKRRTPGGRAVGSVLGVLAAVGITAAIGLAAVGALGASVSVHEIVARVGVVLAIAVATFGATATVTGAVGDGAVRSAIPVASLTTLPIALVAGYHIEPVLSRAREAATAGPVGSAVNNGLELGRVLAPESQVGSALTFVALVVGLLWLVYVLLPRLPIPELVPRDRRDETRGRIERITSRSAWAGILLLIGTGITAALTIVAHNDDLRYAEDVDPIELFETYLEPITMATELRLAILAIAAALIALYLLSKLPGVHRLRYSSTVRWLPVFAGGLLVAALVSIGYPRAFGSHVRPELEASVADGGYITLPGLGEDVLASELLSILEPPVGVAIVGVAVLAVVASVLGVLLAVWLIGLLQLLPDRGAPGTLGAVALVGGAIVAAVDGASALVVGGAVACAIVSWDAGVYGVSITEELGSENGSATGTDVDVRRPAIAHTIGAVLAGVGGIAVAHVLVRLAERVTAQTGVVIAGSLIVALLCSFVALKRHAKSVAGRSQRDVGAESATAAVEAAAAIEGADASLPVGASEISVLDVHQARMLQAAGYETLGDLREADEPDLAAVTGVDRVTARALSKAVADWAETEDADD